MQASMTKPTRFRLAIFSQLSSTSTNSVVLSRRTRDRETALAGIRASNLRALWLTMSHRPLSSSWTSTLIRTGAPSTRLAALPSNKRKPLQPLIMLVQVASTTRPSTRGLTARATHWRSKSTKMARLKTSPTKNSASRDGTTKPSPFVCLTAMRLMCGSTTSTMAGRRPSSARKLTARPSAKTWATALTRTHGSLSDRAERSNIIVPPDRLEVGTCLPPPPDICINKKVCYGHGLSLTLSLLIIITQAHTLLLHTFTLFTSIPL